MQNLITLPRSIAALLCTLAMQPVLASGAYAEDLLDARGDEGFALSAPLDESALSTLRGGFIFGGRLDFSFAWSESITRNGILVSQVAVPRVDLGTLISQNVSATIQQTMNSAGASSAAASNSGPAPDPQAAASNPAGAVGDILAQHTSSPDLPLQTGADVTNLTQNGAPVTPEQAQAIADMLTPVTQLASGTPDNANAAASNAANASANAISAPFQTLIINSENGAVIQHTRTFDLYVNTNGLPLGANAAGAIPLQALPGALNFNN